MGPRVQYADEKPDAAYELRIYPGADGCFELYEDEGDNYNYEQGAYAWTTLCWRERRNTVTFSPRKGRFEGMIEHRDYHITFVREGHGTGVKPSPSSDAALRYSGQMLSQAFE
jgi:alpha-D-xyloside xylohydrolase